MPIHTCLKLAILSLFFCTSSAFGQITQTVWPSIGDTTILKVDTNFTLIPYQLVDQTGTDLTWQLPMFAPHTVDTIIAMDPATTPNHAQFPNSNYVLHSSLSHSATFEWGYIYYNRTDSAIYKEGGTRHINSTGFLVNLYFSQPVTEMKLPFMYGMSYGDTIHVDGELLCTQAGFQSSDSCYYDGGIARRDVLDGRGSLIIGEQVFENTYRVRRSEHHIDTFYIATSETGVWDTLYFREVIKEYHTWYDTTDMFLLEVIFDGDGNNRLIRYADHITGLATPVGIPSRNNPSMEVFQTEQGIELLLRDVANEGLSLQLFDLFGRLVESKHILVSTSEQRVELRVSRPGIVFLRVESESFLQLRKLLLRSHGQ